MGVGGDGIRQRAHNVAAVVAERRFRQALRRVERFPHQEHGAAELPQDGPAGEQRLRRATPTTCSAAASFRGAFPVASNLQQQLKQRIAELEEEKKRSEEEDQRQNAQIEALEKKLADQESRFEKMMKRIQSMVKL